jgi:hypothetical protein
MLFSTSGKRRHLSPASAAWVALFVSIMLSLAGCSGKSSASSAVSGEAENSGGVLQALEHSAQESIIIPEGRTLRVRLLETVSSRTASSGQHFDAELAAPVVIEGKTVLPESTPLRGRVVTARPSGRLHNPGYLRLTLDSIQAPNGNWVPVKTSSVQAEGKSHKDRNIALIGGGSGVGAAIGAIVGGGKGAAIGAASGAGAGTAGAYATGRKDVSFSAERKLSFTIVRDVQIS